MRLESGSSGGLAVGEADSRYFRLAAANTATKYQQLYSDGADGHTWPSVDVMHIWNDAGNNWTAFKVNVTNTASGSESKLADFQVGGSTKFSVSKDGSVYCGGSVFSCAGDFAFSFPTAVHYLDLGFSADPRFSFDPYYGFFRLGTAGSVAWGNVAARTQDTALQRDAAGVVKITDGSGSLRDWKARRGSLSEYLDITEMSAPAAPAANTARLYVEDNGSGKTRLMVLFPTGAAQVLATEP